MLQPPCQTDADPRETELGDERMNTYSRVLRMSLVTFGMLAALQDLRDERHFPGMQPVGPYAIHIIVKNGRTMLLGVVNNAADRQIAEVRAREVTGVFEVENSLTVARQERSAR